MKVKKIKIYLAGCMGDWRNILKEYLKNLNVEFLEPDISALDMITTFVTKDLEMIKKADLIVCLINYEVYTGVIFECGFGHALGKPIITIFELKGRIEPFLISSSIAVYTNLQSSLDKIERTIKKIGESETEEKLRNNLLHILYHGTSKENADKILKEGFNKYTYFAKNLNDALMMGGEYVFGVAFKHYKAPDWFENFRCWQIRNKRHIPPSKIVGLVKYSMEEILINKELSNKVFKSESLPTCTTHGK